MQGDFGKTFNFQARLQGSKNQKNSPHGHRKTREVDPRISKSKIDAKLTCNEAPPKKKKSRNNKNILRYSKILIFQDIDLPSCTKIPKMYLPRF